MTTERPVDTMQHSRYAIVNPAEPAPQVQSFARPDSDGAVFALRDGYEVHNLPGPVRNTRGHVFDDVESLATWLNRHAVDREGAEILVDQQVISASLSPAHVGGDTVTCVLPLDPRIQGWLAMFGKRGGLSQREFHLLIRAQLGDLDAHTSALMLATVRDLTITKGDTRQIKLDATGYVRYAAMSQNREISGQIPTNFVITVPVFEGIKVWPIELLGFKVNRVTGRSEDLGPVEPGGVMILESDEDVQLQPPEWQPALYSIEVLLTMEEDPTTKDIRFTLEAPSLPVIMRKARRDAAAYLRSLLAPGFLVGLGKAVLTKVPASTTAPDAVPAARAAAAPDAHAQPPCGAPAAAEMPDATRREAL